jgi:hypothetical protein
MSLGAVNRYVALRLSHNGFRSVCQEAKGFAKDYFRSMAWDLQVPSGTLDYTFKDDLFRGTRTAYNNAESLYASHDVVPLLEWQHD